MKSPLRSLTILLSALCLTVTVATAQPTALTILHSNDTHGHLMPFSFPDSAAASRELQGMRVYRNVGGIARRATLVQRIRQELQKRGQASLLVDVGDFCDGTPFSTEYHGEADIAAMNAVGYDYGTFGNHEMNNTAEQVRKLAGLAKFPLISSNTIDRATGKPVVQPYVIRQVGPVRVGIFGLLPIEAATYPAAKEAFDVLPEVETAKKIVAELKGKADIIMVLSHAGYQMDQRLADAVPDIDVIVGGHSHSRLPSGEFVWHSEDLKATSVNGTVIVQAHQWGGELGRLDLLFDKDEQGAWRVERYRARLLPVTEELTDDAGVQSVVSQFWKPIESRFGEVLGQAAAEFSSRGDDMAEYNLVADAVRASYKADFGMENMGGVRAPILRGPITKGDLVTVDPFNNTVVLFKLTGKEIRQVLQRSTPAVSGIRYRVQNRELVEVTINGEPLDDARTYNGVTNSYFAGSALKGVTVQDTGKPRLDVLVSYIREKGTVQPSYDGRRVVANQ